MQTMTLSHPGIETAALLQASDEEGSVRIAADGHDYLLVKASPIRPKMAASPSFTERLARLYPETLTQEQTSAVDRMIAGE